jgi:hypothetical protein
MLLIRAPNASREKMGILPDGTNSRTHELSQKIDHREGPALGRWKEISRIYEHKMNLGQRRSGRTNRAQTKRAPEKNEIGKEI